MDLLEFERYDILDMISLADATSQQSSKDAQQNFCAKTRLSFQYFDRSIYIRMYT